MGTLRPKFLHICHKEPLGGEGGVCVCGGGMCAHARLCALGDNTVARLPFLSSKQQLLRTCLPERQMHFISKHHWQNFLFSLSLLFKTDECSPREKAAVNTGEGRKRILLWVPEEPLYHCKKHSQKNNTPNPNRKHTSFKVLLSSITFGQMISL